MEYKNEQHTADSGFLTFDPIVLVMDVAKHWLLILLVVLAVGVGTYIHADRSYTPVYRTTTTFVVTTRGSSSSVYTNLSSTSGLASVFTELLNSSLLRKSILSESDVAQFSGTIQASAITETNLLTVTVTDTNPRTAFLVSQAIIEHHETVTYQIVDNIVLEVLQHPTVPTSPINRANAMGEMKRMMLLAAAAICGLLTVVCYGRNTVRSGKEARSKLDCNFLGEIPHERKYKTLASRIRHRKTSILITNPITGFHFVETIRKLRRRVEQHMHGGKVLMVTSLLENEGKSTVAVNLALSMAQKHNNVLLIDCDLRKPACHALLEQHNFTGGLRDVLTGKVNLSEALIREKKSNLFLLLEKRGDKNSGDLLSSGQMQALLDWTRREFDYVVLDLPPMAAVSDAETVMELADASLLVVRQNTAVVPALTKVITALDSGKAKFLGCVLNNVYSTPLSSGQGYGYGKYGHYGQYGHYGSEK